MSSGFSLLVFITLQIVLGFGEESIKLKKKIKNWLASKQTETISLQNVDVS